MTEPRSKRGNAHKRSVFESKPMRIKITEAPLRQQESSGVREVTDVLSEISIVKEPRDDSPAPCRLTQQIEAYQKRCKNLDEKLKKIVFNTWSVLPEPHLCAGRQNVIGIIFTIKELYGFICDITNDDDNVMIPTKILERFENYLTKIENLRRNDIVQLLVFADILDLYEEIRQYAQSLYRVKPYQRCHNTFRPKRQDRYCPSEYTWLCRSVRFGQEGSKCLRYMCNSLMAQSELMGLRLEILAALKGIDIHYNGNFSHPIPRGLARNDDPFLVLHLEFRDETLIHLNDLAIMKLEKVYGNPPPAEFQFVQNAFSLFRIEKEIYDKKIDLAVKLKNLEDPNYIANQWLIGVLSTVETYLLLVQRTYAPFVDKRIGMYGKPIPTSFFQCVFNVIAASKEKEPASKRNRMIEIMLKNLRDESRKVIKEFYEKDEVVLERHHSVVFNIDDEVNHTYNLTEDDFSRMSLFHRRRMIYHLEWEQGEIARLQDELNQVKVGYRRWKENPGRERPEVNQIRADFVAFFSTVSDFPGHAVIMTQGSTCRMDNPVALARLRATVHKFIGRNNEIPTRTQIRFAMESSWADIFRNRRFVYNMSLEGFMFYIVNIIELEIEISKYSDEIPRDSFATAALIVEEVGTDIFNEIIENEILQAQAQSELEDPVDEGEEHLQALENAI